MEPGVIGIVHRSVGLTASWACLNALQRPAGTAISTVVGSAIPKQRNECVRAMLSQPQFKWLLFVDDDQTYPPNALMRLLSHERPVVSAVIAGKYPPFEPWFFYPGPEGKLLRATNEAVKGDRIEKVAAVGTGFVLIRRSVFEAIPEPWFEGGQMGPDVIGEDVHFSLKATNSGFGLFVDTGLKIGHLTVVSVVLDDDGQPFFTQERWAARQVIK